MVKTSDGPCVKQKRNRTKLIPSETNRVWKGKEAPMHIPCLEHLEKLGKAGMQ